MEQAILVLNEKKGKLYCSFLTINLKGKYQMNLGTVLSIGLGGVVVFAFIYYFLTEWNAD
jgi:hypothetical protein